MGLFDDNNEIKEFLNNLIRVGYVSTVDYQKGTARVHFPDDDDIVSYNLQVLHGNTLKNKDYIMPDIDEMVLCLFLPYSVETGFILGSVYTNKAPTPESTGDKRTVVFEDGSRFSYDRKTHQFDAQIEQTTIMANRQSVTVNTPVSVEVTAQNTVIVNTPGVVNISGAGNVNVTGPTITLDGNVQVTGTLTAATDVIADKISLVNHVHTGNQGSPTSAPIKPQQ